MGQQFNCGNIDLSQTLNTWNELGIKWRFKTGTIIRGVTFHPRSNSPSTPCMHHRLYSHSVYNARLFNKYTTNFCEVMFSFAGFNASKMFLEFVEKFDMTLIHLHIFRTEVPFELLSKNFNNSETNVDLQQTHMKRHRHPPPTHTFRTACTGR